MRLMQQTKCTSLKRFASRWVFHQWVKLMLIPKWFTSWHHENVQPTTADCCGYTRPPSPMVEELPIDKSTHNLTARLREWLLERYKASAFNQILLKVNDPLLKLTIDPSATPVATHTPLPVLLHLLDEVNADLDRDLRLGVIRPVSIDEPVAWCHHIVVHAK